jgi:leucyl aminopeptidase (aminopeptidase T)
MREGDLVLVSGSNREAGILEQLAAHVRGLGAHPVLTLHTERRHVPMFAAALHDAPLSAPTVKLPNRVSAQIIVEFGERPAAFIEGSAANGKTFYSRSVRQAYLENDLYPTKGNAETFGLIHADLAKAFGEAVALDLAQLPLSASALRSFLVESRQLQVRHPNGTDLKVRIEGRPIYASDGAISRPDQGRGGVPRSVWLPAGEVYLVPVPGSAEGRVVVERQLFQGRDIQGLTLDYRAGKLTSMTATSGLEPLKVLYDDAGPGKDALGVIDIAIHPFVRGSQLRNLAPAGVVTLFLGNNRWAGGDNAAPFGLASPLPGTTLAVDGRIIVEDGVLKDPR